VKTERPNLRIWILACYWGVLFTLTTVPATWLGEGAPTRGTDKLAHLMSYALLAFLYLWARRARARTEMFQASLVLIAYAAFDELHQPFFGRSCELADFIADGLGIGLGVGIRIIFSQQSSKL